MSAAKQKPKWPVFGFLAEFEDARQLLEAVHEIKGAGYTQMEAYTPLPVEEVAHAIGHCNRLPKIVLAGGLLGALVGFGMQYWMSVVDYPINVGGRPLNSWPSFIVITFEMTILFAALSAVFGMLALSGLPQPYHPVFNVPAFELASRNRFFLMILARDPNFDMQGTKGLLERISTLAVEEVPH